ncbi:hypothetical protein M8C21_010864 [Ambrosia artemisiifolia]|uniref:Eukaryotic translation initiation factor 3 subunit K n=1 Tax=Ambrosia artemisiifolia TaxID=4212 RepID=A0AAD5D480_AMBAR|nr:hypothetical protein M8C21_010864 [Ambrosia artemisiifolia]
MGREQSQMSYTVEQLVAVNPYNPDILPDLQNYVNEQFEPERMNTQIVARILIKALMAMPAPDFSLCLFLIPERVQMDEQFKTLIVLSHYLETAKFRQFWDEAAKNRHILEVVPGFEQAIQEYAVHVLSLTYQKVPRSVVAEAINIEGVSLDKFIEQHGWIVEGKGELVTLPRNEFNNPELRRTSSANSIPLDRITRIYPLLDLSSALHILFGEYLVDIVKAH